MTQQEIKAVNARLARIWEPDENGLLWNPLDHGFYGQLATGLYFQHWLFPNWFQISALKGTLHYQDGLIFDGAARSNEFSQWLPFFRRGCWLSGCPIEVSAHEKAEWMQGFSREELEAWNLKM